MHTHYVAHKFKYHNVLDNTHVYFTCLKKMITNAYHEIRHGMPSKCHVNMEQNIKSNDVDACLG